MADFDKFLKILLKVEGGYVNHPDDKGGCTNKGITINTFKNYYGQDMTCDDLQNITDEQAGKIYKEGYWNPCWGDKMESDKVANIIVDWAVNSGVKTAIRNVQKIVGTKVDGIMGNMTLTAINNYPEDELLLTLRKVRKEFYENIISRNPSQKVFRNGWLNRLNHYF